MNRFGTFGAAVCAGAAGVAALSCSVVLGVEEGILDPLVEGGAEAGDARDATIAPVDAPIDGGGVDAPLADVGPACEAEQADEAHGIFVSLAGSSAKNCGSKLQPCSSIVLGVQRAQTLPGMTTVYVDSGTYAEAVPLAGGITVQGGWDDVGGSWRRRCTETRAGSVKITGASGVGVTAASLVAPAVLDTMTIEVGVAVPAGAGQSLYGVFATGASTALQLVDVVVTVGKAGDGATGATGATGAAGGNCNGTGAAVGTTGSMGTAGSAGSFGVTGYVAVAGGMGGGGGYGTGTAGGAAPTVHCVTSCALDADAGADAGGCAWSVTDTKGTDGTSGCGGHGGGGGAGGGGGGSAIAIYAWDAHVVASGGAASAGNGGAGGGGGAGVGGGMGTWGSCGTDADGGACPTACSYAAGACTSGSLVTPQGGSPGPRGGAGGAGGVGGGGAGGSSYAIFTNASAVVTADGTALAHGAAGPGAGGAPSGKSGERGAP